MATWGPADDETGETFVRPPSLTPVNAPPRPVVDDPLIGTQLGEYRVLSRLGEGGMGIVYRGEQPVIGKPVAIKVLQGELANDPVQVKRLLDEAKAISAARHPNIIDIFSFGTAPSGQQYFVMELLEGAPLDVWLREQGQVPPAEAAEILRQILAALSAAHAAGVIHRDLKPSNIFLVRLNDDSRFVKLLDFGLAKRGAPNSGVHPTANLLVGTPLYMAPEQAAATELGPWTDLYAVGCIAYELLTGTTPFGYGSVAEMIGRHATAKPPPLTQHAPGLPEDLNELVLGLLEKNPARRPKSAAVVRKQLERIERQLSVARTSGAGVKALVTGEHETRPHVTQPPNEREHATPIAHRDATQPELRHDTLLPEGATQVSTGLEFQALRNPWRWKLALIAAALVLLGVTIAVWPTKTEAVGAVAAPVAPAPREPAPPVVEQKVAEVPAPPSAPALAPAAAVAVPVARPPKAPAVKKAVRFEPTMDDVRKRIAKLRARLGAVGQDATTARLALARLDKIAANQAPEECWADLETLEQSLPPAKP